MIIASHKKEKTTTETSSGPWWVARLGWFSHSWLKNRNETILEIYSLCPWGPTVQRDNCNEASKWAKKRQRKTDRPTTTITTIIGTRIATDAAVASSLHNWITSKQTQETSSTEEKGEREREGEMKMKIKITVRYKINAISTEITNSNWYSKISMLLFKAQRGEG